MELTGKLGWTAQEYQARSARTHNQDLDGEDAITNAALGLAGEAGEVVELVKKARYHDKPYSVKDIRDELGDVLFYLTWMASCHSLTLSEIMEANVEKLKRRYPEGFVDGGGIR